MINCQSVLFWSTTFNFLTHRDIIFVSLGNYFLPSMHLILVMTEWTPKLLNVGITATTSTVGLPETVRNPAVFPISNILSRNSFRKPPHRRALKASSADGHRCLLYTIHVMIKVLYFVDRGALLSVPPTNTSDQLQEPFIDFHKVSRTPIATYGWRYVQLYFSLNRCIHLCSVAESILMPITDIDLTQHKLFINSSKRRSLDRSSLSECMLRHEKTYNRSTLPKITEQKAFKTQPKLRHVTSNVTHHILITGSTAYSKARQQVSEWLRFTKYEFEHIRVL